MLSARKGCRSHFLSEGHRFVMVGGAGSCGLGASALHGKVVRALMGCSRFYRAKMLRDAYSERERNILWSRLERVPNEHGADCRQERKRVQTGAAPWARGEGIVDDVL
jgi:hypothetical protein